VDLTKIPATVKNIEFVGTKGTVIKFTGLLDNINPNVIFTNVKFRNITFTTTPNVTGGCAFTRYSSYLDFEECTIQDFVGQFCMYADKKVRFKKCEWKSSSGFTSMNGMIGNVGIDFRVEDCNFNFVPNNTGGVNAVIALNWSLGIQGDIYILNNKFFTDNQTGYFCDTAIDIEPFTTTQLANIHIEGNWIYNAKVFVSSVKNIFIERNIFRTTSVLNGNSSNDNMLNVKTTNSTTDMGTVIIHDNDFIEDDGAFSFQAQPVNIEPSGNLDTLQITKNRIQVNGKATGHSMSNPWVAIAVNTDNMTLGMGISKVVIEDNQISYTSVPSTPPPAISLQAMKGTIYHVKIHDNRLDCPSGACSSLIGVQFGAGVPGLTFNTTI
jgi:hypothetical protein